MRASSSGQIRTTVAVSEGKWVGRKGAARVPGVPPRAALAPSAVSRSRHLATFVRRSLPPHYSVNPTESSRTVVGMDCGGGGVRGGEASVYQE
jgi:hypothetical protein